MKRTASLVAALVLGARLVDAQVTAVHPDSSKGNVFGVVSDTANHVIVGASVQIVGGQTSALTDALGRFAIVGIPIGHQLLRVRAVGFAQRFAHVEISGAETVDGSITLERTARQLDTVRVVARSVYEKPARLDYTTKYDEFYLRRRTGMGRYLTRESIDSLGATVTVARDVANRIPFLRSAGNGAHKCPGISLYLDGRPASVDLLDALEASDLESMEYHRGISDSPIGTRPCSLYVYTR